jgi:hypothetical protein
VVPYTGVFPIIGVGDEDENGLKAIHQRPFLAFSVIYAGH